MTRNLPVQSTKKASRKLQISSVFPPNFERSTALQAVLPVTVHPLLLLWWSPVERVCLAWACVCRVWGRGGNFLSKLETEWVTEFSLSRLQSRRSRKSCHTIPLFRWKKRRNSLKRAGFDEEEGRRAAAVCVDPVCVAGCDVVCVFWGGGLPSVVKETGREPLQAN